MHFRRFHLGDKLLCKPCHVAKGAEDRPELAHGTYYVYWYWNCRCDPCKAANAAKSAALAAKKQQRTAGPTLPLLLSTLRVMVLASSEARTRTENRPVNSRMLCQLSYLGLVFRGFPWPLATSNPRPVNRARCRARDKRSAR